MGLHAQTQTPDDDDEDRKKERKKERCTSANSVRRPQQWSSKLLLGAFSFGLEPAKAGCSSANSVRRPQQWSSKLLLGAFSFGLEPAKAGCSDYGCQRKSHTAHFARISHAFCRLSDIPGLAGSFVWTDARDPIECANTYSAFRLGGRSPASC
jgi:hypothetical protein